MVAVVSHHSARADLDSLEQSLSIFKSLLIDISFDSRVDGMQDLMTLKELLKRFDQPDVIRYEKDMSHACTILKAQFVSWRFFSGDKVDFPGLYNPCKRECNRDRTLSEVVQERIRRGSIYRIRSDSSQGF